MSDVNEPGALAGNSPAASAGERDDSLRSGESAAEKATSNPGALAENSPAASAGERDDSTRSGESAAEKATSNTDPLSIIALAASIAALILTLFSLMPMLAFCFFPIGVVCAATALLCSVASLVRTTVNRKLEGRQQAFAPGGAELQAAGAGRQRHVRDVARDSPIAREAGAGIERILVG